MTVTRLQERRGIAAEWLAGDPNGDAIILASGEIGFETDTNKFKIGDGVQTWLELPYQSLSNLVINSSSPLTLNTKTNGEKELSIVIGNNGVQAYSSSLYNITSLNSPTPGLLKKTGVNTWEIDTNTYITTDTNYYPTAVTMGAGSTSGPTVNLTMSGTSNITGAAIPSASAIASGIVTTGTQTFAGTKTLTSPSIVTSLTTASTSFDLINTTAATVNFAKAATAISIGSLAGTTTLNGNLAVSGTSNLSKDLAINGNKFMVTATTGDTTIAGTLSVTGVSTLANNSKIGTTPIAQGGTGTVSLPNYATATTIATQTGAETLTNKTISLTAGTTTVSPLTFASGTVLTTLASGATEYDGNVLYFTPNASTSGRAVVTTPHFMVSSASFTHATWTASGTGLPLFSPAQILLGVATYEVEFCLRITNSAAAIPSIGFAGSVANMISSYSIEIQSYSIADNISSTSATTATSYSYLVGSTASQNIAAVAVAASSATSKIIKGKGIIRTAISGNLIPQIFWNVTPTTSTTGINSYIKFTPIGSSTVTSVGKFQ